MGLEVVTHPRGDGVLELLPQADPDVVLLDLHLPGQPGIDTLVQLHGYDPTLPVVVFTGHGTVTLAVQAMQRGAFDFLTKPVALDVLEQTLRRALSHATLQRENQRLRTATAHAAAGAVVVPAESARSLELDRQVLRIGASDQSVLIHGESGSGKELVARRLHAASPRHRQPFVVVHCGAIPRQLVESELFGHVKGAFTGAVADREGKFEYASGGTLLLDEVGEMPLPTQVKLLRVLEERAIVRLGDNRTRPVDVRVLAATNADLVQKVKDGSFRQDLYFRLKVVTIDLPSLSERRSDIKLLVEHYRRHFAKLHDKDVESIDRDALVALVQYDWPGNVRELRNAVESMVVRAKGNILTRADLPPEIWAPLPADQDGWQFLAGRTWQEVEQNHIRVSLELCGGNRQKAAKAMGLSERTLYRKIKEYSL